MSLIVTCYLIWWLPLTLRVLLIPWWILIALLLLIPTLVILHLSLLPNWALLLNLTLIEIVIFTGGTCFLVSHGVLVLLLSLISIWILIIRSWTSILLLLRSLHLICIIFVIVLVFNIVLIFVLIVNLSRKWAFLLISCCSSLRITTLNNWIKIKSIQLIQFVFIVNTILIILLICWLLALLTLPIVSILVERYFKVRF